MAEKKQDMSAVCGHHYEEYWYAANEKHTMPQDQFQQWFKQNCAKCLYMSEICMFGEEEHDG